MREFTEFITELAHGEVHRTLTEKLALVTEKVNEIGGKGTLTLKIVVEKEGQHAIAKCDVTHKAPEWPLAPTTMYFGKEGSLHREDPRQLNLRIVPEQTANVRTLPVRDMSADTNHETKDES